MSTVRDELIVKYTADVAEFNARLKQVEKNQSDLSSKIKKQNDSIAGSFKKIGSTIGVYFSGREVLNFVDSVIGLAGSLQKLSDRTGITAESLQRLNTVAIQSDVELSTIANSVQKLQINLGKATAKTTSVLRSIGLDAKTLKAESPEQQFLMIIQKLEQIQDRTLRSAVGTQLFGRQYRELEQIVAQGSEGIAEAMENTTVATNDQVAAIDNLDDEWKIFKQNIKNQAIPVLADLLSFLNRINDATNRQNGEGDSFFKNIVDPLTTFYGGNKSKSVPKVYGSPNDTMPALPPAKTKVNEKAIQDAVKGGEDAEKKKEKSAKKTDDTMKKRAETIKESTDVTYAYNKAVKELVELENKGYLTHQETVKAIDTLNEETKELTHTIADDLTDAINRPIRSFDDLKEMALDVLQKIALQAIITGFQLDKIASPSTGLTSSIGSSVGSGIRSLLGFADGGDPPLNKPSIVGERGAELFMPKAAGTIIPNHELGGGGARTTYVINQSLNFATGVVNTVRAEIIRMMPQIAGATQQSIVEANRRGGAMSIIMNNRN